MSQGDGPWRRTIDVETNDAPDRLDEPVADDAPTPHAGPPRRVLGVGLPDEVVTRLTESGPITVTDDLQTAGEVDVILLSTRLPLVEVLQAAAHVRDHARCPVVALVHTGGEATAVEVVRAGGVSIVSESNQEALEGLLGDGPGDVSLVEVYARHLGRSQTRRTAGGGRDTSTGLADRSLFDERLTELTVSGSVPRVGFARVLELEHAVNSLGPTAVSLLRRRLSARFGQLCRAASVELFAVNDQQFALLAPSLGSSAMDELGGLLDRTARTFDPTGGAPLGLVLGHAGPEVATDAESLCELAERALQLAVSDPTAVSVGADALSSGATATTELEAAKRIVEEIERDGRFGAGHGERVAALASDLARDLGYDVPTRNAIELAAHLHHVGSLRLPPAVRDGRGLDEDQTALYRTYPHLGASYLAPVAGARVATAVRAHAERWDGAGMPEGLVGRDIPVEARIIAVAHAFEELRATQPGRAIDALGDRAGTELDPDIVRVAVATFAGRRRP
jgi:HD-GYP domain-containing protein (c-di-GMP phosphodiesterase class II)